MDINSQDNLEDELNAIFYHILLSVIFAIMLRLVLRRIQVVPNALTSFGLFKEYLYAILFPMDSVRNYITQFVEIKSTQASQNQIESALRAAYSGNGYWVNVSPKARAVSALTRGEIVSEARGLKKMMMTSFYKHNICLPEQCQYVSAVVKDDAQLILSNKISISQSRIAEDKSLLTKVCFLLVAMYTMYAISTITYCLWTMHYIPAAYRTINLVDVAMVIPLLYPFGKCIAPVFITLESDDFHASKYFVQMTENNQSNEDIYIGKVSSTKESVHKETMLRYALEQAIGSIIYTALHFMMSYTLEGVYLYGVEGSYPINQEQPPHFFVSILFGPFTYGKSAEAIVHSVTHSVRFGQLYFTNSKVICFLNWSESILSVVYMYVRIYAMF
ncbi:hypothetical protein K493DRAFT_315229 [Basidiobolus meristosporus CBS 931.73]|uniref:Uncharacterized protein n=1 Tax=Basidiobolus meristosporus CBS 931.73 TaxID=1314790 RepID=A0A1Y1YAK7_9FUNG|nr:hypothetical protein K493DRAFT_315229 [Basidiobolus meristosporus CBS 931.73]|eukprot:ORX95029.1 hypothetical protein K493DRAFT_315229 [Basidiobolus meristosporus CBS 931.73]